MRMAEKGGMALLVIQNGNIVWESYANGGGKNVPQRIYSGTKAYWGLAALVAAEEGLLKLDEHVVECPRPRSAGERRARTRCRRRLLRQPAEGLEGESGLRLWRLEQSRR
jgi:CubicO group peptidase (beta-lactamase class C family)